MKLEMAEQAQHETCSNSSTFQRKYGDCLMEIEVPSIEN